MEIDSIKLGEEKKEGPGTQFSPGPKRYSSRIFMGCSVTVTVQGVSEEDSINISIGWFLACTLSRAWYGSRTGQGAVPGAESGGSATEEKGTEGSNRLQKCNVGGLHDATPFWIWKGPILKAFFMPSGISARRPVLKWLIV
jgi:hypothetical protein